MSGNPHGDPDDPFAEAVPVSVPVIRDDPFASVIDDPFVVSVDNPFAPIPSTPSLSPPRQPTPTPPDNPFDEIPQSHRPDEENPFAVVLPSSPSDEDNPFSLATTSDPPQPRGEKRPRDENPESTFMDRMYAAARQATLEREAQIKASDLTQVDIPDRSDEQVEWVLNDQYDDISNPVLSNEERQKQNEALVDKYPLSTMAPLVSDTFELLLRNNREMYQPLAQGEPMDEPLDDHDSELRKIAVYRPSHISRLLVCSGPANSPYTANLTIFLRPCSRGRDCLGRYFFGQPMMHSLSPSNLDILLRTGRYEQDYHSLCELCNWDLIGAALMDSATDVPLLDEVYRHRIYLSNYGVTVADGPDSYDPVCCLMPESSNTSSSVGTKAIGSGFNGLVYPMPCFNSEWLRLEFDPLMKVNRLNQSAMLFRQSAVPEVFRGFTTPVPNCLGDSTRSTETGSVAI
jgi:hypothetical protein